MEKGSEKYIETVKYLSSLFDFANKSLFNGELKKPVITVQACNKNNTMGWFTLNKVWKENSDDDGEYEINVSAQFLNRDIRETFDTLIHEMCHFYATIHGLKDTSRSGNYHNKLYKKIAETHGLSVNFVEKGGWSLTSLTVETENLLNKYLKNHPAQLIFRIPIIKSKIVKSSSTRKYICPICGNSVRATKQVNIICADCEEPMTEE